MRFLVYRLTCLVFCLAVSQLAMGANSSAQTIDKSRVPDVTVFKAMLQANKQNGWIQFRNYNGRQYIYFTALQTMHCRLSEIRYSLNNVALDQRFDLVECNPQLPFSLPDNAGLDEIAITVEPGTVETAAVQVVWEDGTKSDIAIYEPCKDAGEQTCAWPLQ